jgi:hypothetical protein
MRTSFHHQPEAQHPKFFSYPQAAGRLPHLWGVKRTFGSAAAMSANDPKRTSARAFCCDAVHGSRSKIVLDFQEGGSRPGE